MADRMAEQKASWWVVTWAGGRAASKGARKVVVLGSCSVALWEGNWVGEMAELRDEPMADWWGLRLVVRTVDALAEQMDAL
jgi:hypothetical protein